jgi:hypothetical protein
MKIQFFFLSTVMLCSTFANADSVMAQQNRQMQISPELANLKVTEPKTLANKVELPDLPEFTGQTKLEKGLMYPANDQVESTYRFIYQAKDDPSRIIDWYRTALGMYKWDVEGSTNKAILGTNPRTGNSCSIYCDNENAAGCKLHISYTFMQKSTQKPGANY